MLWPNPLSEGGGSAACEGPKRPLRTVRSCGNSGPWSTAPWLRGGRGEAVGGDRLCGHTYPVFQQVRPPSLLGCDG